MRPYAERVFGLLLVLVLIPELALAQASIAGVVQDASGAVLPGVTVEAASPALIEKVRTVVTDAAGLYRIVDLRPGTYSVTFSLSGFTTFKREGLELTGAFAATLDAEMRVGALEETITVRGEAPIVDVQTATKQHVMNAEIINAVPMAARSLTNIVGLLPGVTSGTGGTIHGSTADAQRLTMNGLSVGLMTLSGQGEVAAGLNVGSMQEVTVDTSAASAELGQGGLKVNIIPREGGNRFSGSTVWQYRNSSMQGSNYSNALKAAGLASPAGTIRFWDFNPGIGGPIMRDRLWFYATYRNNGSETNVPGMFDNVNANDPTKWAYVADPSRPATNATNARNYQLRLTWQVTPKHKLSVAGSQSDLDASNSGNSASISPEARNAISNPLYRTIAADWKFPMTNRILLDAALFHQLFHWGRYPSAGLDPRMISVTEQSTGVTYRSAASGYVDNFVPGLYYRSSMSYITGTHSVKMGFTNGWGRADYGNSDFVTPPVSYRFNNGTPNQITLRDTPFHVISHMDLDLGLFAQDQWRIGRATASYGVRFDLFKAGFDEQSVGPGPLVPSRNITFPSGTAVRWNDVTPKLALAYDLFGTGKTAVKVSLNKYVAGQALQGLVDQQNPVGNMVHSTTRNWADTNLNFVPDCDLTNPAQQDDRSRGGDFCGAYANPNFGKAVSSTRIDPAIIDGWGVRGYNWEFSTGIQQELLPRLALDVAYFRAWYGNFVVADDRNLTVADFDEYSITAPVDQRLPGGGGYTVSSLFDIKPAKFGTPTNFLLTLSDNYGKQIRHWNGFDLYLNARPSAFTFNAGVSIGRTSTDNCELAALGVLEPGLAGGVYVPRAKNPSTRYCKNTEPWLTDFRTFGSYVIPWQSVQLSATFTSSPGAALSANYVATNAVVSPSLGRPLAGGNANVAVNIVEPNTMFLDRVNNLSVRVGKNVSVKQLRVGAHVEVLNALNSDTVLAVNNNYATWLRPQSIPSPRALRVNLQLDF